MNARSVVVVGLFLLGPLIVFGAASDAAAQTGGERQSSPPTAPAIASATPKLPPPSSSESGAGTAKPPIANSRTVEPPTSEPQPNDGPGAGLPQISDSMLDAIPAPASQLSDWRQAVRLIRTRSTAVASAQAQIESANAQASLALARLLPTVAASGSVSRHLLLGRGTALTGDGLRIGVTIPDPTTVWSASVSLRQPIVDLRSRYDARTAKLRAGAQRLYAADTERQVLALLADTIVTVVTAERLAEISRVSLRSSLSTMDLTRRRARLGASSAVDVLRAEQEVVLNRAQVVTANESLRQAREALGMALGYPEAWGVAPEIKLDDLAKDAARLCQPITGVDQRADVRAAQAELELAKRSLKSSGLQLAPTVDLTSSFTYSTAAFTSNGKPMQWTIGGLLSIPLYDGGLSNAEKGANSAQAALASESLIQARRQAALEVAQALRGVDVAEKNFQVSRQSRDLSLETSRLARLSFVNGRATSFELVDAEQRHRQAELDLAVKEFEVVRARIIALLAQANCDY